MKRKIIVSVVLLFVVLSSLMIYKFVKTYNAKATLEERTASLPTFLLKNIEGVVFSEKQLTKGNWVVFVFFNSGCHYCQSEAKQLKIVNSKTTGIEFVWISSEEVSQINSFQKEYHLKKETNVVFLHDSGDKLAGDWGISATPQFMIYSPSGKLFKNHKGALRIDTLISQIKDESKTY